MNDDECETDIVYEIILGCEHMVQPSLIHSFKNYVLYWNGTVVSMKYPGNMSGKPDLTNNNIRVVVIQTL